MRHNSRIKCKCRYSSVSRKETDPCWSTNSSRAAISNKRSVELIVTQSSPMEAQLHFEELYDSRSGTEVEKNERERSPWQCTKKGTVFSAMEGPHHHSVVTMTDMYFAENPDSYPPPTLLPKVLLVRLWLPVVYGLGRWLNCYSNSLMPIPVSLWSISSGSEHSVYSMWYQWVFH